MLDKFQIVVIYDGMIACWTQNEGGVGHYVGLRHLITFLFGPSKARHFQVQVLNNIYVENIN